MRGIVECPWCAIDGGYEEDDLRVGTLCDLHLAEYEGTTLGQLQSEPDSESEEWMDDL